MLPFPTVRNADLPRSVTRSLFLSWRARVGGSDQRKDTVPKTCVFRTFPRLGGTASLETIPIGRDKAKARWFSKSKSICAGGSGKVPRLCAIWTPQCGGMKGKLCFIKRKSRNLVSNNRVFREKNISFFENREKLNENLWTFFRNAPSFLFFLPAFGEKTPVPSPPRHSPFLPPQLRTRGRTRPCASRTQRVRNSSLHPSPSPASC